MEGVCDKMYNQVWFKVFCWWINSCRLWRKTNISTFFLYLTQFFCDNFKLLHVFWQTRAVNPAVVFLTEPRWEKRSWACSFHKGEVTRCTLDFKLKIRVWILLWGCWSSAESFRHLSCSGSGKLGVCPNMKQSLLLLSGERPATSPLVLIGLHPLPFLPIVGCSGWSNSLWLGHQWRCSVAVWLASASSSCSDGMFSCASGECLPVQLACDFQTDCPDVSDEDLCGQSSDFLVRNVSSLASGFSSSKWL